MATSLAAQAQQAGATYSAPGVAVNENIATPATSRYISQRSSPAKLYSTNDTTILHWWYWWF